MATYQIQIVLLALLLLYQPLEILFTRKRVGIRTVNSFSWTLLLSLFSVSTMPLSAFQNTYELMVLIVVFLLGLATILVINKTISGNSFKVSDVSGVNLSVVLKKAIESIELKVADTVFLEDNRKSELLIDGSKRKVCIEQKETPFSKQYYYILRFDRWYDGRSKREILDYLSDHLSQFDLPKRKRGFLIAEAMVFVAVTILFLAALNSKVLHETSYQVFDESNPPECIKLIEYDRRISDNKRHENRLITDPLVTKRFYEGFSKAGMRRIKNMDQKILTDNTYYQVTYGQLPKSIYVKPSVSYLYIPLETIKEMSVQKKIMVSFYELYSKNEGFYFMLNYDFNPLAKARELFTN